MLFGGVIADYHSVNQIMYPGIVPSDGPTLPSGRVSHGRRWSSIIGPSGAQLSTPLEPMMRPSVADAVLVHDILSAGIVRVAPDICALESPIFEETVILQSPFGFSRSFAVTNTLVSDSQ